MTPTPDPDERVSKKQRLPELGGLTATEWDAEQDAQAEAIEDSLHAALREIEHLRTLLTNAGWCRECGHGDGDHMSDCPTLCTDPDAASGTCTCPINLANPADYVPCPMHDERPSGTGLRCRICGGLDDAHDGSIHDARVADMPIAAHPDAAAGTGLGLGEEERDLLCICDWPVLYDPGDEHIHRCDQNRAHVERIVAARVAEAKAAHERLRTAILDIDAHATPMGLLNNDDPEGSPHHYAVTPGALHRALGVVGHSAAPCPSHRSEGLAVVLADLRCSILHLNAEGSCANCQSWAENIGVPHYAARLAPDASPGGEG